MKKMIFIAAFLWLNVANAQSLTREKAPPVNIEIISKLEFAVGYRLINGEWIGFDRTNSKYGKDLGFNAIPNNYFFFDDNTYSEWSLSRAKNFKDLVLFRANYQGNSYLILKIESYSGRYKYPTIKEDWYEFREEQFLIISDEGFESLKNNFPRIFNESYREEISVFKERTFRTDLDDFDLEKKARLTIESREKDYFTPAFLFDIFPIDHQGQKIVRLNFYFESNYSEKLRPFNPSEFDNFYFEIPWSEFLSFLFPSTAD